MTIGLGFRNKRGIVLAADGRTLDEYGMIVCDHAQKLFQLSSNSGVVISGCTPYEYNESIHVPFHQVAKRLRENPPDETIRRQAVLRIMAESIQGYLLQSAQEYPSEHCRIDVIFGDYDGIQGYLLLQCGFQYRPTPEQQAMPVERSRCLAPIYETFTEDRPDLAVRCSCSSNKHLINVFAIGVLEANRIVDEYLKPCTGLSDLKPVGIWEPDRVADIMKDIIDRVAHDYPSGVNNLAQVAVIDKNGIRRQ